MTDVCMNCRFRKTCEELEHPLDCTDQNKCEHYDNYLEALESPYYMDD